MTRLISPFALGYSILAGPILWFAHFIVVYGLAEFGCRANFKNMVLMSPDSIQLGVIILTVPALLAIGVGGVMAYRNWNMLNESEMAAPDTLVFPRFLATLGMLFSALFLLSILFTVAPAFVLSACDKAI